MSDKSKLQFSFISLVLSVSGRVRPVDLQGIPESERAGALRAFYEANSATMPMRFDGDDLVRGGGGAPAPVPAAAPQAASIVEPPPAAAPSDYSLASTPVAVPSYDPSAPQAPVVDFMPAAPAAPPADFGAPVPASIPEVMPPASPPVADFAPPAPMPPAADAEWGQESEPAGFDLPPEKVSFLYWLLPVLLTWLGGIIAFFLVRKKNPKQAKSMLITGIVLTVVFIAAGAAAFFLLGSVAPFGF